MSLNYIVQFSRDMQMAMLTVATIVDYIAVGRAKVLKTKRDPYRKYKRPGELAKMMRHDAKIIYAWFTKLRAEGNVVKTDAAYDAIVAIQHGPRS